jgi:hypothetical protein
MNSRRSGFEVSQEETCVELGTQSERRTKSLTCSRRVKTPPPGGTKKGLPWGTGQWIEGPFSVVGRDGL